MSRFHPICWPVSSAIPKREGILATQQKLLAFIEYLAHSLPMGTANRTVTALMDQFNRDYQALKQNYDEQRELRPLYDRFCELDRRSKIIADRIRRLMVMLWMHEPSNVKKTVTAKAYELGIALPEGFETTNTWESAMEVVRAFPNIQMVDLLHSLVQDLGMETSRQSVDSALTAHPELFSVRKSGKGKYISLREDADAAATKRTRK